jgi:hypothetical protein
MKDRIDKFSCFLTGFNYNLIFSCSEVARKMLKRYAGLLVLISIVWSIIGFGFATRYLKLGLLGSLLMAVICVFMIVLIERNIILARKGNNGMFVFRFLLAIIMAVIGSLIIDQIIFSEDIEEQRIVVIQNKVNKAFPEKSAELKEQIVTLNDQISNLEERQVRLSDEVSRNPTIKQYSRTTSTSVTPGDSVASRNMTTIVTDVSNPKINELSDLQELLKSSYSLRQEKDSLLLELRASLQKEYQNRRGFLDELTIMLEVVSKSWLALAVYIMWFLFFLAIELFIVFSKIKEEENDYHRLIQQQMDLHNKRLDLLEKNSQKMN